MIYANPQSNNLKVPLILSQQAIDMAHDIIREFEIEPLHTLHSYLDVDSYYDDHRALMIWADHQLVNRQLTPEHLRKTFMWMLPEEWLNRKELRQRLVRHNMKEVDYLEPPLFGYTTAEVCICNNILNNIEYPHWVRFNSYLKVAYHYTNNDALLIWIHNKLKDKPWDRIEVVIEELTTELWMMIPELTVR
ncbi:hypothetical protein KRX19_09560 [Cardiobacteriaceae bacterium TAE3-ERU3]|nr:hypothetical protein [Cardiobacteriaceae bacterium TAE3-ERU3]